MIKRLPPAQFAFTALSGFVLIALLVFMQMLNQPWLGLQFSKVAHGEHGLLVSAVASDGPAAGKVLPGQQITAIANAQHRLPLNHQFLKAPDTLRTFEAFNVYLAMQQKAADILKAPEVSLILENGKSITVHPESRHPISAIPILTILYLLSGFLCVGVGLLLWRYRPNLFVTQLILAAGTGSLIYYLSVILQYRELALSADWLRATAASSALGTNLFSWGQLSIFMVYPMRAFSHRSVLGLFILIGMITLNNASQWIELPVHTYFLHFLLVGVFFYYLLSKQWRITQHHPIEHAVIKLFILILAIPTALVFILWMVPIVVNSPT